MSGELSLAGEVRPVTQAAQRRTEAKRLGYTHTIDDRAGRLQSALDALMTRSPRASGGKRRAKLTEDDIAPF